MQGGDVTTMVGGSGVREEGDGGRRRRKKNRGGGTGESRVFLVGVSKTVLVL